MELNTRKNNKTNVGAVFAVLFVCALAISVWKLAYGFGWYDESFYITIPHRMLMGDAFIADEWHPAQLFGFLTMPFLAVYRLLHGNMEGVMLYMRIVYVCMHFLIGAFLYKRLSEENGLFAAAAVFSFLIFSPFDIMAPSYNSICTDVLAFLGVGLATEKTGSSAKFYILYGLAYAASVLCCPFLVILLPWFLIVAVRGRNKTDSLFIGKRFAFFMIGIAILFLAFVLFECKNSTLSEIFQNFRQLFMDAEHTGENVFDKLKYYFNHAPHHFVVSLILFGGILLGLCLDKNKYRHASFWIILSCLPALWGYAWSYANLNEYYNALMMPLFFPGTVSYILLKEKPKRLFYGLTVIGLIYSICVCISSNVGFHAVSLAYSVANIASWCFIGRIINETHESMKNTAKRLTVYLSRASVAGLCAVLLCLLFVELKTKATHVFYDEAPAELTETIAEGPAKGLRTTAAKAGEYNRFRTDIESFTKGNKGKKLLVLSEKSWCYLIEDGLEYATYSAWLSGVNEESLTRLGEYYEGHMDKTPDLIYIEKPFVVSQNELYDFAEKNGYSVEEGKISYKLLNKNDL